MNALGAELREPLPGMTLKNASFLVADSGRCRVGERGGTSQLFPPYHARKRLVFVAGKSDSDAGAKSLGLEGEMQLVPRVVDDGLRLEPERKLSRCFLERSSA